jgi:hypothetical protein
MLIRTLAIISLLAGTLPLASYAQGAPRFYVGAGANLHTIQPFSEWKPTHLFGPSLTAGLALSPRLAVQLGVSYHAKKRDIIAYSSNPGQPLLGTDTYSYYYLVMPALLRYTITSPSSPWHVDGLAGGTLVHVASKYISSASIGNPEYKASATRANLTVGPALRYTFLPNVEFTANALLSAVVGDTYYRFSDRLFFDVLVGAQYSFGKR